MEVTINGNLIEIVKDDSTELIINGAQVVDEGGIRFEAYNTAPPILGSDPYTQPTPTSVTKYKVVLHLSDNRWETLFLGDITNQPGWTDDLAGANQAVSDISAALVVSGGGGGGGVTSVTASAPLSSSGGATPNISLSGLDSDDVADNSVLAAGTVTAALDLLVSIIPPAAPVDSVNGQTGVVVLEADDIDVIPYTRVTMGVLDNVLFRNTGSSLDSVSPAGYSIVDLSGNWSIFVSGSPIYWSTSATSVPFADSVGWSDAGPGGALIDFSVTSLNQTTIQDALENTAYDILRFVQSPELRTGASIAFNAPAVYNTPTTPSSSAVTLDLSGAIAGTEVVAYFDHASEPTWPAGVSAVGLWNNSALNVVRFLYRDSGEISAVIVSDAANSPNPGWITVTKPTTESRNTTTVLTADTDLRFPMLANTKYRFKLYVWAGSASSTPGLKYGFTGPASPTLVRVNRLHQSSGTSPANTPASAYDTTGLSFTGSLAPGSIRMEGQIENGANAGDFQFTWSQNTSNGTDVGVTRGSWIEYQSFT